MNTLEWLAKLISFDTTSRNSNLALIDCAKKWFEQYGCMTRISTHPCEPKANLFATLPCEKSDNIQGGIIFSGHTDVVPVDGQAWKTNPFEAVENDGKIYGRGTCDMKGFLAVLLTMLPEFSKLKKLKHPLHFAFSYDEEVGCKGAPILIADLQKAGIKPAACLVGEPTEMRPVFAHKGLQSFRCKVQGKAAHSSLTPKACNAIDYAAELICHIRSMAEDLKNKGPFDKDFDLPFTSISTNMIQGGIAHNIIPAQCEFFFEFRHLPNIRAQDLIDRIKSHAQNDLLPRMQQDYADAKIELDAQDFVPAFEAANDSRLAKLIEGICKDHTPHKVAYATEAGLFQKAAIPTMILGPGSIEQAHAPNEFITIDQLQKCEEFLRKLVYNFST